MSSYNAGLFTKNYPKCEKRVNHAKFQFIQMRNGKSLGFPGFDDPETIGNQCAGQWVVCLTCHHSISVLGRKSTL